MNLTRLFETQDKLDQRIVKEKGLEGQDLLPEKILSLRVELGEFANELPETFKFWSNKKNNYEKALIEYVDSLHFILSIGLELGVDVEALEKVVGEEFGSARCEINDVFLNVSDVEINIRLNRLDAALSEYEDLLMRFLLMGNRYGFEWEQIEQAYYSKNKINHERQATGY